MFAAPSRMLWQHRAAHTAVRARRGPMTHVATAQRSDEELMDAYCAGDVAAFDELFRRYAPRLVRFCRTFVGTSHAPDVVQVTFMKAHENRHRFTQGAHVAPWLFTIARNTALDHIRSAPHRREQIKASADAPDPGVEVADPLRLPDSRDPLALAQVRAAVAELPQAERDVVLLHWFGELPFDEVARVVKASAVAVRARASRAYARLRSGLATHAPRTNGPRADGGDGSNAAEAHESNIAVDAAGVPVGAVERTR